MRTEVTYLDKNNNRVNKEEAWTVEIRVYNDAGNLQRVGHSIGEAQQKATAVQQQKLLLTDMDTGKEAVFSKNIVKAGREAPCDLIIAIPEKKKIDKIHATFERREGRWYITDQSKSGTLLNGVKLQSGRPALLNAGDVVDFAGKKKYSFDMPV